MDLILWGLKVRYRTISVNAEKWCGTGTHADYNRRRISALKSILTDMTESVPTKRRSPF